MVSKFSQELKDQVIKEVMETGSSAAVARKHNLNPKTDNNLICSVRNKDVIDSNKQIRNLQGKLADRELEIEVLKALLKKTFLRWQNADTL